MTQLENTTVSRKGKHLTFGEMNKIEGYKDVNTFKDYGGNDRVTIGVRA